MKKYIIWALGALGVIAVLFAIYAFLPANFNNTLSKSIREDGAMYARVGGMEADMAIAPQAMKSARNEVAETSASTQARLIIRRGEISLVVEDIRTAIGQITELAAKAGGFVVSSRVDEAAYRPYGEIVVRVPSKDFDANIGSISSLGVVHSESVTGNDVTEEYVDLGAQMVTLKASEAQFLKIMEKAVEIKDVLAVQVELTKVQKEIKRIEDRQKYLKNQADMSTITVHLSPDEDNLPVVDESDEWKPLAVVKDAVRTLRDFGIWFANVIITLVVFIPVWGIGALVIWFVVRRFRKGKK